MIATIALHTIAAVIWLVALNFAVASGGMGPKDKEMGDGLGNIALALSAIAFTLQVIA